MSKELKHYNIFALQGDSETTDQDVCETLGLDPKLANTPAINEAAIAKQHRTNYYTYVTKGMDHEDALRRADDLANAARTSLKRLLDM
jgi:hypothetical protein